MESSNICSDKYEGINISIDARKVTFYLDGQSFEAILSGNIYARNPNPYIASSLPYICSFSVDYNAELCKRLKAEVVLKFNFDESLHESFNDLGIAHQNVEYLHIFQVSENIFIKRPIFYVEQEYRLAFKHQYAKRPEFIPLQSDKNILQSFMKILPVLQSLFQVLNITPKKLNRQKKKEKTPWHTNKHLQDIPQIQPLPIINLAPANFGKKGFISSFKHECFSSVENHKLICNVFKKMFVVCYHNNRTLKFLNCFHQTFT
jgi:hypothetical protein